MQTATGAAWGDMELGPCPGFGVRVGCSVEVGDSMGCGVMVEVGVPPLIGVRVGVLTGVPIAAIAMPNGFTPGIGIVLTTMLVDGSMTDRL